MPWMGFLTRERRMMKMNSRKSSIILKYNRKKATPITDDSCTFEETDCASGEADKVTLTVQNKDMKWLRGSLFPKSSDYIKVSIKVSNWKRQGDNRTVYQGKYHVDDFTASGFPSTISLSGISIPIHTPFNKTERNKTYKKTSVREILQEISKRSGIKLVFHASNQKIDEISQGGKTDMSFAFDLCSEYGICMKVYNGKLVAYDQTRYEKRKAAFTLDRKDLGDSGSYDLHRAVTKVYDGVKFTYENKDGKKVVYKYIVPGKKGSHLLQINASADSHADAEKKAKAKLAEAIRQAMTASFQVMGDPKWQAAKVFKLTGFGKFNGRYFIDKVTHQKSDKYTTSITCHKCVTNIH